MKVIRQIRILSAIFFGVLLLIQCTQGDSNKNTRVLKTGVEVNILSYSSFLGKGSLGEWIKNEAINQGVIVKYIEAKDAAGIHGELARLKRQGKISHIDFVIGLDKTYLKRVEEQGLVTRFATFAKSPFSIMVDTQKVPEEKWPKNWKELVEKYPSSLLVQDPRSSNAAIGWIKAIYDQELISRDDAKKLRKRVFPSWSSSYSAFLEGEAPFVWSYNSSEAYHRCEDKENRYQALPLSEGYPVQEELLVWINKEKAPAKEEEIKTQFWEFLLSKNVQEKISMKNWMWPADNSVELPKCFAQVQKVKELSDRKKHSGQKINEWLEDWTL